ncbi:3028_t:CDS:2, partial [Racocetra persica]
SRKNRGETESDAELVNNEENQQNLETSENTIENGNMEDSEGEIEDKKGKISRSEKKRKESRERVLNHLENCSDVYKLREWDNIYSIVANYVKKEEEIKQSNSLTEQEEVEKAKSEAIAAIKIKLESELSKISELRAVIEHNAQK